MQELLLFDVPLLPAGLGDLRLLASVQQCNATRLDDGYSHMKPQVASKFEKLRVLYAQGLKNKLKASVIDAIVELGPEENYSTRDWYVGLPADCLRS